MNEELSNKIMERIETNHLTPLPHWRFVLLRGTFWLLSVLSVIIGSLAFGAILFLFFDFRRHGLSTVPHDVTELLLVVPYIWIVLFLLFIVVTRMSIKYTRKGYRYSLGLIILASLILIVVFGSILNFVGVGRATHEFLNEVPLYNSINYDSKDAWNRPRVGKLAGVISSIQDNKNFSVIDFSGHVWQVRLEVPIKDKSNNLFVPEASSTIRMFGLVEASSSIFIANSIFEWEQ